MKKTGSIRLIRVMQYAFAALATIAILFFTLNFIAELGIGGRGPVVRGWVQHIENNQPLAPLVNENGAQVFTRSSAKSFFSAETSAMGGFFQGKVLLFVFTNYFSWILLLSVLYQLARIFKDIDQGTAFRSDTIRNMRYIAIALMAFPLFRFGAESALCSIARDHTVFKGSLIAPVHNLEWMPLCLFAGLAILAGTELLERGRTLQQEQELTV